MKQIYYLLLLLAFTGCGKGGSGDDPLPDPPEAEKLSVSPQTITASASGETFTLTIQANIGWKAASDQPWAELSAISGQNGGNIVLTCKANPLAQQRSATITFTGEQQYASLTVTQQAAPSTLSLDRDTYSADTVASEFVLKVTTNRAAWSSTGIPDWVTLTPASGDSTMSVQVAYQSNPNTTPRSAPLTFISGAAQATLQLTQKGREIPPPPADTISLDITGQTVEAQAGSFSVAVTTAGKAWTTADVPAWITLTPATGKGSGSTVVSYDENPENTTREATITFTSGTATATLTITQEGKETPVQPDEIILDITTQTVDAQPGSFSVAVTTAGKAWTTTNIPAWITLTPAAGEGSTSTVVSYEENPENTPREATVTFTSGTATATLTITQEGKETPAQPDEIILDITTQTVDAQPGSFSVAVTTAGKAWTTTGIPAWITLTPDAAKGSTSTAVSYEGNPENTPREATITFSSGTATATLIIRQEGKEVQPDGITLDITTQTVDAQPGSFSVAVTTAGRAWTTANVPAWITLTPDAGEGSTSTAVSYDENPENTPREATITFTSGTATATLTITQEGKETPVQPDEITLDITTQTVDAQQGSFSVAVTTAGKAWTTTGIPAWITLTPAEGEGEGSGSTVVSYDENPENTTREATITFTSGTATATLTITQEGKETPVQPDEITLDITTQTVGAQPGSFSVAVTTAGKAWTTADVPAWITLTPDTGESSTSTVVSYDENPENTTREATITFTSGTATATLTITQEGKETPVQPDEITLDITTQTVDAQPGSFSVAVTTAGKAWTTTGIPTWITLTPDAGEGSTSTAVSYDENPENIAREATITFTSGTATATLTITQNEAEATLSLNKNQENVQGISGSFQVELTTNGAEWTTSELPAWISLTPASGKGSGTVTVNYQANPLTQAREATFYFYAGNLSAAFCVRQAEGPAVVTLDKTDEKVETEAGTFSFNLTLNGQTAWTATDIPAWMRLSPSEGYGSSGITAYYDANPTPEARQAVITFSSGDSRQTLTVTQAQKDILEVVKATYQLKYTGGTVEVELKSNIPFTATSDADWLTVVAPPDATATRRTFQVAENTTGTKRTAHITFSGKGLTQTVTIEQSDSGKVIVGIEGWEDDGKDHGGEAE